MPYNESEAKAKIREIRNSAVPVLNGYKDELEHYEVKKEDFQWLLEKAEKVERYEKALKEIEQWDKMDVNLFEFNINDFEEVYAVIDNKKQRLHISPVNYSYSITLDLTRDLKEQIKKQTQWGDTILNNRVRKVVKKIIGNLGL